MPIEEYWTMKDGSTIAVGEMSLEHLQNTLRLIIRNSEYAAIAECFEGCDWSNGNFYKD